jgi:hypothetical protein
VIHAAEARRQALMSRILRRTRRCSLTGCAIWLGPTGGGRGRGYPRMCVDGRTVPVHRVVAMHHWGFLPPNKQVDHLCKNKLCVEPTHLEPVTHLENQRRRVGRGTKKH